MDRRIPQLLDMVELSARATDRIDTLSGGLKRRLTLARALVNEPEFLVLDEPTTGLDPQARHMIWSLVHRMKRNGKTILLTTHYMEEAERLCDQLMIIDNGTLLAQDSPTDLIRKYCESDVLEIRGGIPKEAVGRLPPSCRTEHAGESLYIYSNHAKPLLELAQGLPDTACLHRHSGLEDVFLRLTGRELRG